MQCTTVFWAPGYHSERQTTSHLPNECTRMYTDGVLCCQPLIRRKSHAMYLDKLTINPSNQAIIWNACLGPSSLRYVAVKWYCTLPPRNIFQDIFAFAIHAVGVPTLIILIRGPWPNLRTPTNGCASQWWTRWTVMFLTLNAGFPICISVSLLRAGFYIIYSYKQIYIYIDTHIKADSTTRQSWMPSMSLLYSLGTLCFIWNLTCTQVQDHFKRKAIWACYFYQKGKPQVAVKTWIDDLS